MIKISLDIDQKKLVAAFAKAPKVISKTLRTAMKEELQSVAGEARKNHRFTTRSGMLERSMQVNVEKSGLIGEVEIDPGIAVYGRRIHEGGGGRRDSLGRRMTNKPDRFLYNAFNDRKDRIVHAIKLAIGLGFSKVGLK